MFVNVIPGGDPSLFNRMLFPEATPETQQWIYEQFHRDTSMLSDLGRRFIEGAGNLYKQLNDPSLMRKARNMARNIKGIMHPNMMTYLDTVSEVQSAKPVMQRYIMAMPEIRKLYHKQLCDGYSESYVDHEPDLIGEDHYDYRRVMNGIVQEYRDADGNDCWKAVMYPDDLAEGDRELDIDEKFMVLKSWDLVKLALGKKKDPTDVFNGDLEI